MISRKSAQGFENMRKNSRCSRICPVCLKLLCRLHCCLVSMVSCGVYFGRMFKELVSMPSIGFKFCVLAEQSGKQ